MPICCSTRALLLLLAALGWLLVLTPTTVSAQSASEIMQRQRERHRVPDEDEVLVMTLIDRNGNQKQRKVARRSRTVPDDLNKILVRFLAPRDVENTGLLTWEAKDGNDDQWLYLPATRRVKRVAASGKKDKFMGTEFAYEDLRAEGIGLNTYTLLGQESIDGQECWVVQAVPASEQQARDSGHTRRTLWVRTDNYVTVKRLYYDKKGALEKVQLDRKLVNPKGTVWRANEIEMRNEQTGARTILVVEDRRLDAGLGEDLFTEAGLMRGGL